MRVSPLAIKPAVEDGTGVEVDRHAVRVPGERGEVSDRGHGPGEVEPLLRDGPIRQCALQHRLGAVAAQVPVAAPVDASSRTPSPLPSSNGATAQSARLSPAGLSGAQPTERTAQSRGISP